MNGWIGVDLDGTLAEYHGWPADGSVGKPIPAMVERVKRWIGEGREVHIFTARVWPVGTHDETVTAARPYDADDFGNGGYSITRTPRAIQALLQEQQIEAWCLEHLGANLPITCVKDYGMLELWDDRAVQVIANTGEPMGESTRGL